MTPIAATVVTNESCPQCDASIGDLCIDMRSGRAQEYIHNLRLTAGVARAMEYRKDPALAPLLTVECPECGAPSGFACTETTEDGFKWCAGRASDAAAARVASGWAT